jgi:hypothetical protein
VKIQNLFYVKALGEQIKDCEKKVISQTKFWSPNEVLPRVKMKCIDSGTRLFKWTDNSFPKFLKSQKCGEQFRRKKSTPTKFSLVFQLSNEVHRYLHRFRQQLSNLSKTPYALHYISTNTLETVGKVTYSEYATIIFAWHCMVRSIYYLFF